MRMKRKLLCAFALCFLSVSALADAPDETERLVVYTSHKEEVYQPIVEEFERRTGVWVQVVSGGTTELLERIAAEAETPVADVMFGGGVESLLAYEDYFMPCDAPRDAMLAECRFENHCFVAFSRLPLAIIYNPRLVSHPPAGFADLLDDGLRGQIAFANPAVSGSSFTVLATLMQALDDENALVRRRSVERQKELNDTRIRMMQSQLNPHFLYNTLDSMKWMGVTHGVPQVATLAEDLAKILRASISGDEFVTLGQELDLLERYIDIQLIRFEDRFACEIEVDDALMSCMVPKLVLQPIVENAVIHGVRDMDDGYIKIWAERDAEDLRLFVQDNGCGMEKPQDGPLGFGVSGRPGEHLGMFNVDSILRLHFGDAYGLSVRSKPGEGCLVMVRLPMRREKA